MKKIITLIILLIAVFAIGSFLTGDDEENMMADKMDNKEEMTSPSITPISHASFVMNFGGQVIYNDPVGGSESYEGKSLARPNIILVSDIHGDHLNIETLESLIDKESADKMIIAPQAVYDEFTEILKERTIVMNNGDVIDQGGISIEAIPMYNLPERGLEIRHEEGRGNGYLLEKDGFRVYIAGDTADIPEMRALTDIDIAFVPMNLPYTMTVEDAANGVLEFKPKKVYPYHYRGQDGFGDIDKFKEIVNSGDENIEVVFLEWY
ncbi:MBL fold metallo-hydrolase [Candidatus Pacebacteria bacterium]|nr:MBL fold metallo-hydrolase [Candidatus Paceibacterota bacterium]